MNGGLLAAWRWWDAVYQRCTRLQYVEKGENLFRVVLLKYHGDPLTTRDGVRIEPGDWILKLHLHNLMLAETLRKAPPGAQLGIRVLREIRRSLPGLARYVASHPRRSEIKGLMGTTFLYRGAESLGFDVCDVPPTLYFRYKNYYLKGLLWLMHPEGYKRLAEKKNYLITRRVYMSTDELLRRYL